MIALSSGESEYYGLVSGISHGLDEKAMLADLDACPQEERPFFLLQYANLIKNGRDLFPNL